ncbi:MAG: dihydrodipicolinate synthase family protein, partial [Clostridia bacterium]
MKKTVFTGAGVAIVTPFKEDLSIDYDVLGKLLDYQIENNTDAIIVGGTTGEASTFSDEEHIEIVKFSKDRVKGAVPIIAGVGSNDTSY